jgi:2-oxoisovalerate dehydrogenase E1 component
MPGVEVDGNDVLAVYQAAAEALQRARAGGGPTLIECKTYRTRAHGEGMRDAGYRTKDEVDAWKARCPVTQFKDRLLSTGVASQAEVDDIETEVKRLIEEATAFAESGPLPDPATVTDHLYSDPAYRLGGTHA